MPTQILFVQGAGEDAHDRWDDKLVDSLSRELGDEYVIHYPRMPNEADPAYPAWKEALLNTLGTLDDGAILIGHSTGGATLIHVLAEQVATLVPAAIILIAAPFIGEGGWSSDDIEQRPDLGERLPADVPVFLFHGTADDVAPFAHMRLYADAMPQATAVALDGCDHQLNNDLGAVADRVKALAGSS